MSYLVKLVLLITLYVVNVHAEEIRIGITSVPLNVSPFYATDANSQNINRITHLSLIDFDQEMQTTCDACLEYSESIKPGSHTISFKLKKDLKFWNGDEVKAEDVKNSYKYFIDPKIKSNHARAFRNIGEIKIVGDFEFRIQFKSFSVENLNNLTLLKIIKKDSSGKIIGCGDYRVTSKSPLGVKLKPVRKLTRPDLFFKVVKDETTLALKIVNKELHLSLGGISPRKYMWLKKNSKNFIFDELPGTNYKYISFNHKNEDLGKLKVRKAISSLIPRREILKYKLHGTAVLSKGLFSPSFKKFFIDSQNYRFDPGKAKRLLEEEGYKKKDGSWFFGNRKMKLEWKVSNNKSTIEIVNLFKDSIRSFGIEVNVTVQEWGTFMKNVKRGHFDMIMGQWIGFTGPDMMHFIWHSDSLPPKGANRGHYLNKEFDRLVNLSTTELDEKKRIAGYKEAQRLAENDFAYLGMWHPNITWIRSKCVKGAKIYPNGGFLGLRELKLVCN